QASQPVAATAFFETQRSDPGIVSPDSCAAGRGGAAGRSGRSRAPRRSALRPGHRPTCGANPGGAAPRARTRRTTYKPAEYQTTLALLRGHAHMSYIWLQSTLPRIPGPNFLSVHRATERTMTRIVAVANQKGGVGK